MNKEKVAIVSAGGVYKASYNMDVSDVIDTKVYDISRSGAIPEMIPCNMQEEGGTRVFLYEIDDKKPLVEVLRSEINKKQMLTLMYNVLQGLEAFGKNMISLSYVAKDVQRVFVAPDTLEVGYIVVPVQKEVTDLNEVRDFIKSIIIDARYSLMDTDNYVAKLINYTNMMGTFSVSDMKNDVGNMLMEIGVDIEMINSSRAVPLNGPVSGNSHILRGDTPAPKVSRLGVMRNNARMNGQMPPMGMPNGQMPPMGMPNGQMPPMGPNGQMPPMGPNGQMPPMGPNAQEAEAETDGSKPEDVDEIKTVKDIPEQPESAESETDATSAAENVDDVLTKKESIENESADHIDDEKTVKEQPAGNPFGGNPFGGNGNPFGGNGNPFGGNPFGRPEPMGVPPMQGMPQMENKAEMPKVPPMPVVPPMPEMSQTENKAEMPKVPPMPAVPPMPEMSQTENKAEMPKVSPMPVVPPMPEMSQTENKAEMPKVPPMPVVPPMPEMPQTENKAEMPKTQPTPGVPPMTGVPPMMGGNPFDEIPMPYFVRVKTGEKIRLDKDEFKIGHKAKIVDYAVSDNSAISRVHCIITKKNGVCFIKDNNSTNGTFLNGEELKEGEEKFLTNNAVVILGDEEFVYHVR